MQACISIIIPSYNRAAILKQVLPSYFKQYCVLEIIVVDDASTDSYNDVIQLGRKLSTETSIHFYYFKNTSNQGLPKTRNIGITKVHGQYILWGEDDAFFSVDYALKLLEVVKKHKNSFAFGSIYYGITINDSISERQKKIDAQQNRKSPIFNYLLMEGYYRKCTKLDCVEVPFGHALILVPTRAYSNISYDQTYRGNAYREESDIQVQILKKGFKALYTPNAQCYHYPTISNSGCHSFNRLILEFFKITNTFIFYDKHYEFLKERFGLSKTKNFAKIYYCVSLLKDLIYKIVLKIIK